MDFDYEEGIQYECGHAVIALDCGVALDHIQVGEWDGTLGKVKWAERVSDWYAFAVVARAGEVAQRRFRKKPIEDELWSDDKRDIEKAVRNHPDCFDGFIETPEWWGSLFGELAQKVENRLKHTFIDAAFSALVAELRSRLLIKQREYAPHKFTGAIGLARKEIESIAADLKFHGTSEWTHEA